jgi:hypothetical protein
VSPLHPWLRQPTPAALLLATLGMWAGAIASSDTPAAVPQSSLHACAVIAAATERLACYDQLAGRTLARAAAPTAAALPAVTASPPGESFGLYAAEHPAAPPAAASLAARIVAFGRSANGRPTVALEGGQLWELDGPDPLLAIGEPVTIRRAALGSFMMVTATKRTHRVRRLR